MFVTDSESGKNNEVSIFEGDQCSVSFTVINF